jgi:TctA family transporter
MLEKALRQSLLMSGGSGLIFFSRPISLAMMLIGFLLLSSSLIPWVTKKREDIKETGNDD